ncbi:G-protein coupled receptor Mth2-like [Sitodiplosis mosellana]|uniref:G-protein coupled receptor Mth2-like n=1 Tax=Sitodiplosis mosellana TaxID=263140 RepID=UPI0024447213|nr:G-protein coupled receptor Mth2-like [Sitodiplosis mosellana]
MSSRVHLIPKNVMGVLRILIIQLISLNWSGATSITTGLPCNFHDSINITDGLLGKDDSIQFNGIIFPRGQYAEIDYILVNGTERSPVSSHRRGCPCKVKTCIRLCCSPGKVFDSKLGVKEIGELFKCANNDKAKNLTFEIREKNNKMEKVNLNEEFSYVIATSPKDDYFYGKKWEIKHTGEVLDMGELYDHQSYCLLKYFDQMTGEIKLNVLISDKVDDAYSEKDLIYAIAMLISVSFIAATFLVYILLPDLRNLHGKCLLGYLSGLIVGYSLLTWIKLNGWHKNDPISRKMIGLITYFSLLSAFFWSNVISYDLHRNFRAIRSKIYSERKRFVAYMIYAWGSPFLLTIIAVVLDFTEPLPDYLLPGIGTKSNFLKPSKDGKLSPFLYFYMLILIIFSANAVLFVVTAFKIRRAQREISKITSQEESARHQSHLNNEKDNLVLFMRLFIIMGVCWIMEAIEYLTQDPNNANSNWLVIMMDIWNLLQGLIVFILFVMKRRVLILLKKKYRGMRGTTGTSNGSSRTRSSSTKTTNTDSQVSRDTPIQ